MRPSPASARPPHDWTSFTPIPSARTRPERAHVEADILEGARVLACLRCDVCGHRGLALLVRFARATGTYCPLCYCPRSGFSVAMEM